MRVYHVDLNEAQADPPLAALFAAAPGVAPFDRIDWLQQIAQCLAPARCFLAVAARGEDRAALALCETGGGLVSLANWYSFTARPRWTDPALLEPLLRDLAPHGALCLAPLPAAEAQAVTDAARRAGWITRRTIATRNHVLRPAGRSFAEWWATRPGQLRELVRRKGRHVSVQVVREPDPAAWDAYAAIYAQSWKPAEAYPQMLRDFAMDEAAAGRLRLGLASVDGRPVAAQLWTVEAGTAYIHKLAHLPEAAQWSPGTVLSHALFAMAFDQDQVDLIDFGTGDDGYKRDWMDEVRLRWRIEACHPRALRHWPALARLIAARSWRGEPPLVDSVAG